MAYRYRTQFYGIPVMGEGDMLTEEQEWIQMNTIDSLLFASNLGARNLYIEEGLYSLSYDADECEFTLSINPISLNGFSLAGIINSRAFFSHDKITVRPLYSNNTYYVYVEYNQGLETDAKGFDVIAYSSEQEESKFRMKLCIVSTSDTTGSVNTDIGKVYSSSISNHMGDNTNPHGKNLIQESLSVLDSLSVHGEQVHGSVYRTVESNGSAGVEVAVAGKTPLFVTVYPEMIGAGEIAWSINGSVVTVYNSGPTGINLNLKIDVI